MLPGLRTSDGYASREEELLKQERENHQILLRTKKLLDGQLQTLRRFVQMIEGQ